MRYAFDNTLSRGTPALIAWLSIVTAVFVALGAILLVITGTAPHGENDAALSFPELMWHNLMRALDAGAIGGDAGSAVYLAITLFVTLGGIFILGTLIGLISNGVGNQIEELRKGRSTVAEQNHIVILGWNPQIFALLNELILGNEHRKRNRIVIMADRDKVQMDDEIRERIADLRTTRVVCRRGSPIDLGDLKIVLEADARGSRRTAPARSVPGPLGRPGLLARPDRQRRRDRRRVAPGGPGPPDAATRSADRERRISHPGRA